MIVLRTLRISSAVVGKPHGAGHGVSRYLEIITSTATRKRTREPPWRSRESENYAGDRGDKIPHSPVIVDEARLQGVAVECRRDEGAGYG